MRIIYLKTFLATAIPALSALSVAWAVYEKADSWPSGPKLVGISIGVFIAGASGLGSFLSTSFADHKAEVGDRTLTESRKGDNLMT